MSRKPVIHVSGISWDFVEYAVKTAKRFANEFPERKAGETVLHSRRSCPTLVVYWTKTRAICVKGNGTT